MKRCPQCNRVETDETLKFCRADGATLVSDLSSISSEAGTLQLGSQPDFSEVHTQHSLQRSILRKAISTPRLSNAKEQSNSARTGITHINIWVFSVSNRDEMPMLWPRRQRAWSYPNDKVIRSGFSATLTLKQVNEARRRQFWRS